MSASNYVHLDVEKILGETDLALHVEIEDYGDAWIPKSQIADVDDYKVGDEDCTISVTRWFADKEGLS